MAQTIEIQMSKLLNEFSKDVSDVTIKSIDLISKTCVKKLKATSPRKSGKYAGGWSRKRIDEKDIVVYNRTASQLTHLLEKGHVIRNGVGTYGRAPAIKHIEPVEEWAKNEFTRKVTEGIK